MQQNNIDLYKGLTPKSLGYYFPAEFAPHDATWLTWPHKEESWPGKIASIYPSYTEFVKVRNIPKTLLIGISMHGEENIHPMIWMM